MSAGVARPFSELFGGRPGDGEVASLARAAARAGFAVLPIAPGSKRPLCTLTARQAKTADRRAAEAARDAGKRNWERVRHACGKAHATTDPLAAHRVFRRLGAEHDPLNIAVEVHASRALVVDADTAAELASFTTLWASQEHEAALVHAAPTVRSPGEVGPDGQWKHSEGGHFWFLLDEGTELGELGGTTAIPIGADPEHQAQLKVAGYVLVPPSVRAEGEYRMASDAHPAPTWLVELVQIYLTQRRVTREHRRDAALDGDDRITLAQSAIAWSTILAPRGWVCWYKVDRCGCEIWTAPGEHASPKSGTFHDPGCAAYDTADGFAHIWTDNPPGGLAGSGMRTFSKIQFVAWSDHGGEMGAAMRELGIDRECQDRDPTVLSRAEVHAARDLGEPGKPSSESGPPSEPDEPDEPDTDDDPVAVLHAKWVSAARLHEIPEPEPLIDGMLDMNSLARVVGRSGHGKSLLMLDWIGHIVTGKPWHGHAVRQGRVAYLVAEGMSGMPKRVAAWQRHHGVALGEDVLFMPEPIQVNSASWRHFIQSVLRIDPVLVVLDTQARVCLGTEENSASEMSAFIDRVDWLRRETGACVALVHHKGHAGEHGRGSSAVVAALDVEIEVTKEGPGRVAVLSTKQKDREDFQPVRLDMAKVRVGLGANQTSVVLTAAGEPGAEPFDTASYVDETSPTRDRLAKWVYLGFNKGNGGTKGEIRAYVKERDRNRLGKPMSRSMFLEAWSELERDRVLINNSGRYGLAASEATRLGLNTTDRKWGDDA